MNSRMEQIIEEIEEYIEGCKVQPLSNGTKIIVNKEGLEELLTELRLKTPDEIKRYQKIISNKEAILADAKAKAERNKDLITKARESLVDTLETLLNPLLSKNGYQLVFAPANSEGE